MGLAGSFLGYHIALLLALDGGLLTPVIASAVGAAAGVTYYEVAAEYGVKDYRYTVVDNHAVLVDPRTWWPSLKLCEPWFGTEWNRVVPMELIVPAT